MVFERLGHFATRYRVLIIAAWVVAAALVTVFAPNIDEVASSDTADFLPSNAPFEHAQEVYYAAFPEEFEAGSTLIVIDARALPEGILNLDAPTFEEQIDTEVGRFIRELVAWLESDKAPSTIVSVASPFQSPTAARLMIAQKNGAEPSLANKVAFVRVSLDVTPTEEASGETLEAIEAWLQAHRPAGVRTYQTGVTPIVYDTEAATRASVDRTIWVTVALVVLMLLLVYRSPVSPLIPLTTVTLAYLITRGVVAYLGAHYITITSYANMLLVVVMYGAGTDYCLFLISRFREEMADDHEIEKATVQTVHRVGETITSSAGTIFVGFMAMIFAEMGIFNTTGPALALGVVISLLAGLSFVPALLATLGDRAFWPSRARHRAHGRLYELTSKWVSTRPLLVIVVIVLVMAPLSAYGLTRNVSYDIMDDLPEERAAVRGFELLGATLGAGNTMPLTVVVTEREPQTIATDIVMLTERLAALEGVADVRGLDDPLGLHSEELQNLLHVSTQLELALRMLQDPQAEMSALSPQTIQTLLAGMQAYLDTLAERFPEVADDPNMLALQELLANPLQLLTRQDELVVAVQGLAERFRSVENPYLLPVELSELVDALPQPENGNGNPFAALLQKYLTDDLATFKLEVILATNPSDNLAMDTVTEIREILKAYRDPGDAVVSGGAAVNADIRDTMNRDLPRSIGFVLLGIFVVLLLMLHSVVAPLYLIGTVVLSFTFTLGVTNLVFQLFWGADALTWYVPFFAFVFLVALGIDYSIFLFGRIKEEVGRHGIREGVHVAVATTGAIITSAGIILSGTFAAAMTGEVLGLVQLGFAVAFGVLVDTFIVRTVLDPALATLFGRWTWWPGGVPHSAPQPDPAPESAD